MNICYIYTSKIKDESHIGYYKNIFIKSLITLFRFYSNDIDKLYILIDNKIEDDEYINLVNDINNINDNNVNIIYKLVDLAITNILKYPEKNWNNQRINRIGLLKFFIPYLVDCDNILYTDIDILFRGNVKDDIYKNFDENRSLFKIFQNGWNSGFILFNCKEWRKQKDLLSDLIIYYRDAPFINTVDNQCFSWFTNRSEKYMKYVVKDNNVKINHPLEIEEFEKYYFDSGFYEGFLLSDYIVEEMNVFHVYGAFDIKEKYFDKIYDFIMNNE